MTGNNVTKLNITKNLVEKIAELLNAEVHYSYLLNYKGEEKRKISIIYKKNETSTCIFKWKSRI